MSFGPILRQNATVVPNALRRRFKLLSDLLGDGQTSWFSQRLQFETQTAVYTSAFYDGTSLDQTTFGLVIVPSEGVGLQEAEAALDKAIADFIDQGIDIEQLERLKKQFRAAEIYAQDSVQGLANAYGRALTSGLTLEDIRAWPDIVQSIQPDEILSGCAVKSLTSANLLQVGC